MKARGAPIAVVGVIVAAIVLLPETAAAVRAAARNTLPYLLAKRVLSLANATLGVISTASLASTPSARVWHLRTGA